MSETVGDADTMAAAGPAAPVAERYAHYRFGTLLGRGGMGEVIAATDERIGRSVAIKRMRYDDAAQVARFLREAKIQGRLEHPAIVPVYELGQDAEQRPLIVMKQLRGTTLAHVLARLAAGEAAFVARFTRQRLLRAFADVCLAVEFAHQHGIIHRDLKPANITLGDFGEVYVLDWGIARVLDEADEPLAGATALAAGETVAGTVLGTPGYMAPEQARGEPVDARADVYALGCILFEILAGEPLDVPGVPSRAGTLDGRPSTRAPGRDIPPELDRATVHATSLAREDRPATAREVGAIVEGFLDGDRDVAQRKKLAASAYRDALDAIARGDGEGERRDAIRAAGRALALDPDSTEYGELVARLMIEPPRTLPPEVEREARAQEIATIAGGAGTARRSGYGVLLGLVVLYWAGVRDPAMLAIVGAGVLSFMIARGTAIRGATISRTSSVTMLTTFGLMTATASYAFSPLATLPLVIHVCARAVAQPHLIRGWHAAVVAIAGTLLPVLLGMLGVTRQLIDVAGSDVILHTAATTLVPIGAFMYLLVNTLLVPVASVLMTFGGAMERERAMRTATLLQAWQLRQLVPLRR